MPRTDFSQEIDGAFAGRNAGQRHFSEVARSGNGNMRRDLLPEQNDYEELIGVDERTEAAVISGRPGSGPGVSFRYPKGDEKAPMMPKQGFTWLRKIAPTSKPGTVRVSWVQVSKLKLLNLQRSGVLKGGGLAGLGEIGTGTILSLGAGLAAGVALWFLVLRKKKA